MIASEREVARNDRRATISHEAARVESPYRQWLGRRYDRVARAIRWPCMSLEEPQPCGKEPSRSAEEGNQARLLSSRDRLLRSDRKLTPLRSSPRAAFSHLADRRPASAISLLQSALQDVGGGSSCRRLPLRLAREASASSRVRVTAMVESLLVPEGDLGSEVRGRGCG